MPLLSTYSAASIRGWRAEGAGGGIVTPGTLVTATWNDNPSGTGVEDTLAWYSTNNQQWASTNFYNNEAYAMAYDGQTLLAVGGSDQNRASFSISTNNGLTWQSDTLVTQSALFSDALFYSDRYGYFTDVFLVVDSSGELWTIKDGVATEIGRISVSPLNLSAYANINWGLLNNNTGEVDTLLVTGSSGIWSYVPPVPGSEALVQDPRSWRKTYDSGENRIVLGVATSQSLAVAIVDDPAPQRGVDIVYTTDNINWQTANISSQQNPQCIVWDGQRFVVATREGRLYTSTNGANWTLLPLALDLQYGTPNRIIWNGSNIWGVVSQAPTPFNTVVTDNTKSFVFRLSSDLTLVDYQTLDTGFIKSIINITPGQPSKG